MKKYEFTGRTHEQYKQLKQIRLLNDLDNRGAGTLGGFIESENCLSQQGLSWIGPEVLVLGNSVIRDNAKVFGTAVIADSLIENSVLINGGHISDSTIGGFSLITDDPTIKGCRIYGNSVVYGKPTIQGPSSSEDHLSLHLLDAKVYGHSTRLTGKIQLIGATVHEDCIIENIELGYSYMVFGPGTHLVRSRILSSKDYCMITGLGQNNLTMLGYLGLLTQGQEALSQVISFGDFFGTQEGFLELLSSRFVDRRNPKDYKEYLTAVNFVSLRLRRQ